MSLTTTTHLNFPGTAAAALEFYRSIFGGQVFTTTYGEVGMPAEAPDAPKVVFGLLESDSGFRVMAYDIPGRSESVAGTTRREQGATITDAPFFLSVRGESFDEVQGYWDQLSEGASVVEPLAASAWSPGFGMLTDRYGVTWSIDVAASRESQ